MKEKDKERLDILLFERGLAESREKAKRLIMGGKVIVDNQLVDKPGKLVSRNSNIRLKSQEKYVSRGGYKLEGAWKVFKFDIKGKTVCDIGASTGGFTDFLLQKGAKKIFCIDVGYGQLHWKIRNDPRVVVLERTNARYITSKHLGEKVDLVVCDVSFISIKKILPVIKNILKDNGTAVILIKPQFEAGKENVGKGGIVKSKNVQKKVINDIINKSKEEGLCPIDLTFSPIKGSEGNIEFFLKLNLTPLCNTRIENMVDYIVETAWEVLGVEK
ncbi:TlyA family RNA methyltransferase [Thermosipho ferrireducens]|uniref:TlyA family RNA methyltransferase n=1 Tax=Thermosipho ferrireducens TaxID=2571116 RepID=A0ABX7SB30_9BACT|nr:TlyA family RNA methyltransferase [Thermosipho ferrireducens]QTA38550.1 TlyA family RNA methyltransferase [Thermosipho ferrireducens]